MCGTLGMTFEYALGLCDGGANAKVRPRYYEAEMRVSVSANVEKVPPDSISRLCLLGLSLWFNGPKLF